jgi:hypothetical protein
MTTPPPTRRGALGAIAAALMGYGALAATTDPRLDVPLEMDRVTREKRQRRVRNDTPHDFDMIPPETEAVLTRRGTRVRDVRPPSQSSSEPAPALAMQRTRRGRRLLPVSESRAMAMHR